MWNIDDCPVLAEGESLKSVILEMTNKPVGGCAICEKDNKLLGILVEGDIRRTFTKDNQGLDSKVEDIMNESPVTVGPLDLAYDALLLMEKRDKPVHILPVVESGKFLGFLRLHDLLKEGFSIQG